MSMEVPLQVGARVTLVEQEGKSATIKEIKKAGWFDLTLEDGIEIKVQGKATLPQHGQNETARMKRSHV